MRPFLAGLVGLIVPGAGHALIGRRRLALIFAVPVLAVALTWVVLYLLSGRTSLLGFLLTPGVLPALVILNVVLAAWRIASGLDAARRVHPSRVAFAAIGVAVVVLVLVPHFVLGRIIGPTSDFLDSMFPSAVAPSHEEPAPTDMPTGSDGGFIVPDNYVEEDLDLWRRHTSPTVAPIAAGPRGPMGSGVGTLPALGAAVPWTRAGAIPWGDDGRFARRPVRARRRRTRQHRSRRLRPAPPPRPRMPV